MEKKSYIFSELGIILLGFSIYESIFSPANITENFISGFPKGFMVFSKPEFTAERASFVVAYVFVIVLLIFDMHRYQYESIPERRRIGLIALACMLFIWG